MPDLAENQHCFPVALDARRWPMCGMVIFADLNPIPLAVDYRPLAGRPMSPPASSWTSAPRCAARCNWRTAHGW
jgi:hypothetical protein